MKVNIKRVIEVKIFTSITRWYHQKKQKHIDKMKQDGKCPTCYGKGFATITYPYAGEIIDCHSCNGTGLYTEWEKKQA